VLENVQEDLKLAWGNDMKVARKEGMDGMRGAIIDMTKNAVAGIDIVDGHPELFRKTA